MKLLHYRDTSHVYLLWAYVDIITADHRTWSKSSHSKVPTLKVSLISLPVSLLGVYHR